MLSNAEVDKPVRAPLLALLLLWLLDASADDDVAPRDSSRPAFSGGLSGDSRTWRYVERQFHPRFSRRLPGEEQQHR